MTHSQFHMELSLEYCYFQASIIFFFCFVSNSFMLVCDLLFLLVAFTLFLTLLNKFACEFAICLLFI